jgi:hypothetical protein
MYHQYGPSQPSRDNRKDEMGYEPVSVTRLTVPDETTTTRPFDSTSFSGADAPYNAALHHHHISTAPVPRKLHDRVG